MNSQLSIKKVPDLRFSEFDGEWDKKNLLDLSKNGFSNGVFNDQKKVGSGYKLINVKDMYQGNEISLEALTLLDISKEEFEKNKIIWGDILFTRSSLVKEGIAHSSVFLCDDEFTTYDGHLIKMSPDRCLVDPKYLGFVLVTDYVRRQLVARGKTTTMTTIGQEDISSVLIVLGKLKEQKKIATFLSAVDTKIEQLSKKKSLLEQYKKGMMQKIFNNGKLKMENGKLEGENGLRFKDDQGNEYPNWEEVRLRSIAEIIGGGTPESGQSKYWGGDIQWFTPTEIKQKYLTYSKRKITEEGLKKSSAKILPEGTLLLSTRASIGDVAIANRECSTNQGFQSLIIKTNNINEFWYYWVLENKKTLLRLSSGSTFLEISKSEISKIKVLRPCQQEQKNIAKFLSAIDQKIELVSKQLEKAQTFKKGLLQQMFI